MCKKNKRKKFFQIGVLLIFICDLLYNFFPSDNYQYLLAGVFMIGGVLFFNQKWIAYMHFDQKWKTILIFLFLLSFIVLIYLIISLEQNHYAFHFDVKSSLLFILLMVFNFTYLSVSILISTFNLPTSPVFDKIQNESYLARKVQENLIPTKLPNSKKIKISSIDYVSSSSNNEIGIELTTESVSNIYKIFEKLDYKIVSLDRVLLANFSKKDLGRGKWRFIEKIELSNFSSF